MLHKNLVKLEVKIASEKMLVTVQKVANNVSGFYVRLPVAGKNRITQNLNPTKTIYNGMMLMYKQHQKNEKLQFADLRFGSLLRLLFRAVPGEFQGMGTVSPET